ncbi:MAG: FKBP-type peptidyl-prolyl cis-trans isomerase [Thermoleophilia bacterium]|jgi:FKBP-type peptidyl-prolyl cis-trans isomerase SlyD
MKVTNGTVVTVHYTLSTEDGVLDSTEDRAPLTYLHGYNNIIRGLEEGLEGREAGDKFRVTVEPWKGYGMRDERAVFRVPRNNLPTDMDLQLGMELSGSSPKGSLRTIVVGLGDDVVTLDSNHPLAGLTLFYDVDIVSVRESREEEREQGRVAPVN